ncbi:hypothetical protein [Paenibacillus sp. SI8]|uniref:hypothetical protein n=1 Tax=unclassified Paenibacillus TaxID=185978 RepID=UPI0034670D85
MYYVLPENTTSDKARILAIYHSEQSISTGFLPSIIQVSDMPVRPVEVRGKQSILFITKSTTTLIYEYEDRELTIVEQLEDLRQQNAQIILALVENNLI